MKKTLALVLMMGLSVCGCAGANGEGPAQTAAASAAEPAVATAPEPAAAAPAKPGKKGEKKAETRKVSHAAKSEADIRAELEVTGRKLVLQASRTITPSKADKSIRQSGKDYVASYIEIDPSRVSTEMRPGAKAGQYVGFVKYVETFYECRAKSKKDALAATNCQQLRARRMNEMIQYDGKAWRY